MATEVIMPQLGESVVEGTVGKWLKQEGDYVEAYEPILEVITDKVDTEITASVSGTLLKIYVAEDVTVAAGTLLAYIGEPGEEVPESAEPVAAGATQVPSQAAVEVATAAPASTAGKRGNGAVTRLSPVVARIAAEHNIDVAQVLGTGKDGRVTKKDIMAFVEGGGAPAQAESAPWEVIGDGDLFKPTEEVFKTASGAQAAPQSVAPIAQPGQLVELSKMHRRMAEHMVQSKLQTAPHVTTVFEMDMSAVMAHRTANKEAFAQQGANLTYTAYLVAASAVALRAYPTVNSQWTDEGILLKPDVNVGVAAATDAGLIVPVVKQVDGLSLLSIARAVNELTARARAGQLKPDDITNGTFTITNHGVSGSLFATPIINQPQTAILGVGAIQKRTVVVTDAEGADAIAIRPMMYVGLTFDHRVLDGAAADGFLSHIKQALEGWN